MSVTTITRVSIFDSLCEAVDMARVQNAHNPKRLNLIDMAWAWLLEQEEYRFEGGALLFPSRSEPGVTHHANGLLCDCPSRVACTHNEAASLIGRARRYQASTPARPAAPTFACARPVRQLVEWGDKSAQALVDELF